MPKYNVTNIPGGFKAHMKSRFALLNQLTKNHKNCKTRAIIQKEWEKAMLKQQEKKNWDGWQKNH